MVCGHLRPHGTVELVAGVAQQHQRFPGLGAQAGRDAPTHIVDDAEHPDHRRGQDCRRTGLVVETHVATGHRNPEVRTAIGQTADRLRELPHHAGVLGEPKFRQLVTATGVAPVTATLRYASANASCAPA